MTVCFNEIILTIPERGTLEDMRDSRMGVWLIALVEIQVSTEEGREIFVHDDGLQRGNDSSSGCLENVLVIPAWIHLLYSRSLNTEVSVLVSVPAKILILVS